LTIEPCTECGFDPARDDTAALVVQLRGFGRRYTAPLTRFLPGEDGDTLVRRRPQPNVWSPLEYAAHVRDVMRLFDERVRLIVASPGPAEPELPVVDWDALVESGAYDGLDRVALLGELDAAAAGLAATAEGVSPAEWARSGRRAGEVRTIDETVRRAVHEGAHHLLDIGRGLRMLRGR
jgi:hypothetical protein